MASTTKPETTDKPETTAITAELISAPARWEYRVLRPWRVETLEEQLNELGAAGWELLAFVDRFPVLKRQTGG